MVDEGLRSPRQSDGAIGACEGRGSQLGGPGRSPDQDRLDLGRIGSESFELRPDRRDRRDQEIRQHRLERAETLTRKLLHHRLRRMPAQGGMDRDKVSGFRTRLEFVESLVLLEA